MPSTFSATTAHAASFLVLLLAVSTHAHLHDRSLLTRPASTLHSRQALSAMTYQGCFSSSAGLTDQGSYMYQTSGYCQPICVKQDQAVLALSAGSNCWCGDTVPPASSKVDDSSCNTPCNGYGQENCGGTGFYSVYLSGTDDSVGNAAGSSSSSGTSPSSSESSTPGAASSPSSSPPPSTSSPSTTASPSVVTSIAPGQTVIVTQPASQQASSSSTPTPTASSKSHTNVAGIAAGVVVGVVAVAAIIGGLIFWLKRRKQKAAEDEYKRSTQANDFLRGREPKPPMTGYSGTSDSRLDPTVGGRRNSAGSIADAEDYSRRILRVANPDGNL